ncbi:MAG: ATPase, T2SS/T4P/T4SS family [Candidatus Azambacteria bacterium]|nr:ATPase, T2SS/T4P/T4SS family [Candidatus Azambacteria bacterium]
MRVEPQQLMAFLLDGGLAKKDQLDFAQKEADDAGKKIEAVLIEQKIVTEEELIKLKAYILGIPFVNLEKETIPLEVLQIIPEPIARKYSIVAFRKKGSQLEVAMTDPEDIQTIEFVRKKANLTILPRLTNSNGIAAVLAQYQKSLEEEFSDLLTPRSVEMEEKDAGELASLEGKIITTPKDEEGGSEKVEELVKAAEDLPVIKIVDSLLRHAITQSASDIHIEPAEKEVIVRYRIDGILHDAMTLPKKLQQGIAARIKVLSSLRLDEHRLPQDGRFKLETSEFKISFRVSIIPVYDGEKIVMRLLREEGHTTSLEGLGIHSGSLERVLRAIQRPSGMFLVTGPTGSGKTTTLYTALEILNTPEVNISTIEDPIEYRMPRVNQTQVKPQIGLTFANGLRSLLRQDPNIVMVGEIRDSETATLGVNAALTGHLVLTTLHTNSAAGALPRLIDMGVEPFLIASTVNAILAQRLVRKLCPEKEKYQLTKEQIKNLGEIFNIDDILKKMKSEKIVAPDATWETIDFFKAKPTKEAPSGYKGRVGVYEVLEVSENIRDLILKKESFPEIERAARAEGMITMVEDGFIKAAQGYTSIEEILRVEKE